MKFSAILSSAAVAAAAVIDVRAVEYSVSNFTAGCIKHSTQCIIAFNVTQPGETIPVRCEKYVSAIPGAGGPNVIPNVIGAGCNNSSRTFDFVRNEGGASFSVSQQVSPLSNRTGSHELPSSELVITYEPNAWVENYTGPSFFNLE
ncbi:hypersensitive response-inducing protein [Colletotrichum caudatum]|nr:hypersensitive response-inducing protein [Colletotrichum caudatum]